MQRPPPIDTSPIILDHTLGIVLDRSNPPFNNYQAFGSSYAGLKILADTVRHLECSYVESDPHAAHVGLNQSSRVPDVVPCAFNWFSVTLVSYLRLIALVQLMGEMSWKSNALVDPNNGDKISTRCREYVRTAIPEIYLWRNKVAAHFAATDPFKSDNLGTLEHSIMTPVSYHFPFFYVGVLQWNTGGESSQLESWALTKTYEDLSSRFWPEMTLRPVITQSQPNTTT